MVQATAGIDWQAKARIDLRVGREQAVEEIVHDLLSDTYTACAVSGQTTWQHLFDRNSRGPFIRFHKAIRPSKHPNL
jgi:hypothetical protein